MSGYVNLKSKATRPKRPPYAGAPWPRGAARSAVVGVSVTVWVVVTLILALAGAAALGVSIAAYVRDNQHHSRTHQHIKPVGFSVYKNDTQTLLDNTTTIVTTWTAEDGWPAYDASKGRFNATSGIFTIAKTDVYAVTGVVCFTATANGTREARLVTSGAAAAEVFTREAGDATLSGDQCLEVHQIMNTVKNGMIWLEAFSDSGNTEAITSESRFSIERVARNH